MLSGFFIAVCAVLLTILQSASPVAQAAEIRVISVPAFIGVFKEIVPKFENTTGHKVLVDFEVGGPLMRKIDSGERFDVAIIGPQSIDLLISRGRIAADSRVDIARVGIGVWVRPGTPKRDISSVEAFKRMLIEAKSISYTREGGAGIYMAGLIERLGLADIMKPKTRFMSGGGQNQDAVAAGVVEYGISVASDGAGRSDVELLGLLPREIQNWIVFVGGVAIGASDPASARSYLKFLVSPEARLVMKAYALEPETR
jgi:molybdate transport system substrate-binding protein